MSSGFTSVSKIRRQTVEWDAILSPLKVLRIQTGTVSTEDKKTRKLEKHGQNETRNSDTFKRKADFEKIRNKILI